MPELSERGFEVYDRFKDIYHNDVRVQESSLASHPAVWIFVNDGGANDGAIHLDYDLAGRLIAALEAWRAAHPASA